MGKQGFLVLELKFEELQGAGAEREEHSSMRNVRN